MGGCSDGTKNLLPRKLPRKKLFSLLVLCNFLSIFMPYHGLGNIFLSFLCSLTRRVRTGYQIFELRTLKGHQCPGYHTPDQNRRMNFSSRLRQRKAAFFETRLSTTIRPIGKRGGGTERSRYIGRRERGEGDHSQFYNSFFPRTTDRDLCKKRGGRGGRTGDCSFFLP